FRFVREIVTILFFYKTQTCAAAAKNNADVAPFIQAHFSRLQSSVGEGQIGRRDGEGHCMRNVLAVLWGNELIRVEAFDLAGDPHRQIGRVKARDFTHAASALPDRLPELFPADAYGADAADAGNDCAPQPFESSHKLIL